MVQLLPGFERKYIELAEDSYNAAVEEGYAYSSNVIDTNGVYVWVIYSLDTLFKSGKFAMNSDVADAVQRLSSFYKCNMNNDKHGICKALGITPDENIQFTSIVPQHELQNRISMFLFELINPNSLGTENIGMLSIIAYFFAKSVEIRTAFEINNEDDNVRMGVAKRIIISLNERKATKDDERVLHDSFGSFMGTMCAGLL